ncbi:MAG TPA: cytochrome C oxidase subunit IV family protein [Candidatus Binatia bacterium]|nr:cytochrome C oxidase subunit IV family protein [Candidatus Binatia bacterium]
MHAASRFPSYGAIWTWLVALLVVGLFCAYLPFGKALAIFLVFSVAAVKAFLVVRHYMHLRSEGVLIYAIAGLPLLLLIGFVLTLVPDIVFKR